MSNFIPVFDTKCWLREDAGMRVSLETVRD